MNTFSIKDCISFGWQTFKSRPWVFILAGIVLLVVQILMNILAGAVEFLDPESTPYLIASIVVFLITFIVSVLAEIGTINFFLKAHDNVSTVAVKNLWFPHRVWQYLVVSILGGLMILGGLVLLIVPGIILALALSFTLYLVVDQGLGIRASIKRSFELTKGNRWKLFLLGLALMGLIILGFLALVVGLIVAIPVTYLASIHAYRVLSGTNAPTPVAETVAAAPAAGIE